MPADYQIIFARSARKEVEALDAGKVARIFPRIEALSRDPRPPGCRKIVGARDLWRIRIGDHRVVYSVDDEQRIIDILVVRHRSKAYL